MNRAASDPSTLPKLDATVVQAVVELRAAIRRKQELERLDNAKWNLREARLALEQILEEA